MPLIAPQVVDSTGVATSFSTQKSVGCSKWLSQPLPSGAIPAPWPLLLPPVGIGVEKKSAPVAAEMQ